jgi:hypothetical protein
VAALICGQARPRGCSFKLAWWHDHFIAFKQSLYFLNTMPYSHCLHVQVQITSKKDKLDRQRNLTLHSSRKGNHLPKPKHLPSFSTISVFAGVFSMDGDIAPLRDIVALAESYNAYTFVDDCHATGFVGAAGRGTDELCGVQVRLQRQWNICHRPLLLPARPVPVEKVRSTAGKDYGHPLKSSSDPSSFQAAQD